MSKYADELMESNEMMVQESTETNLTKRAYEVHAQILQGEQAVENGLYQMAQGFKIMRDEKLYKDMGYSTFEQYCEGETGIRRRQVYKYIAVAEKLSENFVHSNAQIGVAKLELLSTLTDTQREELTENVDLESITVKEMKAEIEQLREDKATLTAELQEERNKPQATVIADPKESDEYKELAEEHKTTKHHLDVLDRELTKAEDLIEKQKVQLGLNTEDLALIVIPCGLLDSILDKLPYELKKEFRKWVNYRGDKR